MTFIKKHAITSVRFQNNNILVIFFLLILTIMPSSWQILPVHAAELTIQVGKLADILALSGSGEVLEVSGSTAYINLGQKDGISKGNQFEAVRLGKALKVSDQIVGYREKIIARLEVIRARRNMAICNITTQKEDVHAGDRVYQLRKGFKRIVISQFVMNGSSFNRLTEKIQEQLLIAMVKRGTKVVERSQLERVLREQKLNYSGLITLDTAKKVGQLLGANGIILGTASDMGDSISINARLVDLETGIAVTASSVDLPKTPVIEQMMSDGILSSGNNQPSAVRRRTVKVASRFPSYKNGFFKIEAIDMTRREDEIVLKLRYTNISGKPLRAGLLRPEENTYLVDEIGNQYPFKAGELRNDREFPAGVPRISEIVFRVPTSSTGSTFIFAGKLFCSSTNCSNFFATIKGLRLNR